MTASFGSLRPLTGNSVIDGLTSGAYWDLGSTRTVTWSIAGYTSGDWLHPVETQFAFSSVFGTYSDYANIKFQFDSGIPNTSGETAVPENITISVDATGSIFSGNGTDMLGLPPETQLAKNLLPVAVQAVSQDPAGDIWVNAGGNFNHHTPFPPSSSDTVMLLQEIGHTLGLKHPDFAGMSNDPLFAFLESKAVKPELLSIMAFDQAASQADAPLQIDTPMILDVLALQDLYGPAGGRYSGLTSYTLTDDHHFSTIYAPYSSPTLTMVNSTTGWDVQLEVISSSNTNHFPIGLAVPAGGTGVPTTLRWLYGKFNIAIGSNYDDKLVGSSGNDNLWGLDGNDTIDGGQGTDTVGYQTARQNNVVMRTETGYTVIGKSGTGGSDSLLNIEKLSFSDTTLSLQYNDLVQALYLAYFGRAADPEALLNYQATLSTLKAADDVPGLASAYGKTPAVQLTVDAFSTSEESKHLYVGDTKTFVSAVYHNLFNRGPDKAGLDYWADAIDQGRLERSGASLAIMAGAFGNTSEQGILDANLVRKKIAAASNFTFALDTPAKVEYYRGDSAAASVRSLLSDVDANTNLVQFQNTIETAVQTLSKQVSALSMAENDVPDGVAAGIIGLHPDFQREFAFG